MVAQVIGTHVTSMPGLHLNVQDAPIQVRPFTTWMDTLNVSIPSLRNTPADGVFSGLPPQGAAGAPGDSAATGFQKNFSFGFTPAPTYWVTFANAGEPQAPNVSAGNPGLQMAPQLKA